MKIDRIVLLAKMSDGSIHQIYVTKETEDLIGRLIVQEETTIKINETALEGIDIN